MDIVLAPVAQVQKDRAPGGHESVGHGLEPVEGDLGRSDPAHMITAVILEKVDAPGRKALGIFDFMVERSLLPS